MQANGSPQSSATPATAERSVAARHPEGRGAALGRLARVSVRRLALAEHARLDASLLGGVHELGRRRRLVPGEG
ncbi:MAG TPA: hypothetical protein VHK22_00265 [Gaiellaceae bacterium]|jgi:hypothetical protein|nr:hypothetical protein [Gaiellaceae bacterium]